MPSICLGFLKLWGPRKGKLIHEPKLEGLTTALPNTKIAAQHKKCRCIAQHVVCPQELHLWLLRRLASGHRDARSDLYLRHRAQYLGRTQKN